MVTVVGAWVSPKRDRPLIEQWPKLAPFLPDLDDLHDALLSAGNRAPTVTPEALVEVRAKIKELDRRHDSVVRGIDDILAGLIHLAPKESTKLVLEALRETLLPEGRRVVSWSMRRQGGAAERAQSRLTAEQKKALRELKIPGGTLLGFFRERVSLARRIVELDDERLALLAAMESSDTKGGGVYEAELAFTRTAGLFVANLEASDLPADERARLMGSLEAALENAHARKRNAQADRALDDALADLDSSAASQPADDSDGDTKKATDGKAADTKAGTDGKTAGKRAEPANGAQA